MPLQWEGFLDDARPGNVGGDFEYFDTESNHVIIQDGKLIGSYSHVVLGDWIGHTVKSDPRELAFNLSQFVPRHLFNFEIWAVGIAVAEVPEKTGRFYEPPIPEGFYLYRFGYFKADRGTD